MTTTNDTLPPGRVRPFADVLRDIQGGEVADETAVLMQQLVAAVGSHGKKGSLTLVIEVQPMKGNAAALMVSAQASIKPPKGEPQAAVFFWDGDNNLVRENPKQAAIPGVLREIKQAATSTNIREV